MILSNIYMCGCVFVFGFYAVLDSLTVELYEFIHVLLFSLDAREWVCCILR